MKITKINKLLEYLFKNNVLNYLFCFFFGFIFIVFRFINIQDLQTMESSLNSLLRNEYTSSNSYALSKSISDLELLGVIKCISLIEKGNTDHIYFDTSKLPGCGREKISYIFSGINGIEYEVKYEKPFNYTLFFFEITIYIGLLIVIFLVYRKTMIERKLSEEKIRSSNEAAKAVEAITKQVAHDIRSPLSALNIITSTLNNLPEEKRLMIRNSVQRINDIANDLLQRGKISKNQIETNSLTLLRSNFQHQQIYNFLISTVIDNIVSEKRIQFREKINIQINVDLSNSFGLFINANPNELSRVISNLINNSVEALPMQTGNIVVSVYSNSDNNVIIQIKDDGIGIPKNILAKFGQAGVSHGKDNSESGNGLGVYHAIKTIQELGGNIQFQSVTLEDIVTTTPYTNNNLEKPPFSHDTHSLTPNTNHQQTGTTILIEIPKAVTPDWFAQTINLNSGQMFITVDDDISIHQIWKGRLESLNYKEKNIQFVSFTSANEFREYFNTQLNSDSSLREKLQFICLVDYEFLNQNDDGLKIINELGIQSNAILVTSRFDEPNIRNTCELQKIKILPKQLAGQIPVDILTENIINLPLTEPNKPSTKAIKTKYDLCLIDDDKLLIHSLWGLVAKEKNLNIKMYEKTEDFLTEADKIDKLTPIYIDVSLGNNVDGVDVADMVHKLGFENINLATGYSADSIKAPNYIRNIIGKDFPELI